MGGKVVSGQAVIQQATQAGQSVTTITQSTPKATLSWQSFNVGSGEAVRFVQPSANALSINRISDPNGSKILGKLSANGQVWLINPAGVFFGPGAQVNVGGLVADHGLASQTTKPNLAELASDSRGPGPTNGRQVCHSAVRLAKHRHYSQALHPCTPVPGSNWSGNSNNQQLDLSKT
jgi:filamentous hemagglutinin family protein